MSYGLFWLIAFGVALIGYDYDGLFAAFLFTWIYCMIGFIGRFIYLKRNDLNSP